MKTKLEIKTTEEIASPNMTSFHVTAEWEKYVLKRWVSLESLKAHLTEIDKENENSWGKIKELMGEL